jgi:hypothetical protein
LTNDTIKLKFYYAFDAKKAAAIISALHLDEDKLLENKWIVGNGINTIALLTWQ